MKKENQITVPKKKKGFAIIALSFIVGCMLCKIAPVISERISKHYSKKSHEEKLKNGYYDD